MATSLSRARAEIGLMTPHPAWKRAIWKKVKVPLAHIDNGYTPTPVAEEAHHVNTRYKGISGGWRAGKSLWSGMEGVTWLPIKNGLVWIVAVDYDTTRQEFMYIAEAGVSCGLVRPNDVHLSLNKYTPSTLKSITGTIVQTRTLSDYKKLASQAPDLIIVCEPGLIRNLKDVMELVAGRVSEKRGQVIVAGTSDESSEEWFDLWTRWQTANPEGGASYSMPSWDNHYRYPGGRSNEEFITYEAVYGEEALLAHYGGIPAPPRSLVLRGYWAPKVHIDDNLDFNPELPIEIAIDPNYSAPNSYSVEAIQWDIGTGDLFMVDEVSESGLHHDAIKKLVYDKDWMRYVHGGTIDPFAEGSIYGGPPPVSYWAPLPLRYHFRPKVASTVQAIKEALALKGNGIPRMRVSSRCTRFIKEAGLWKVDKYGRPEKTWCDAMKATGYWLVDRFGEERTPGWEPDSEDNVVRVSEWSLQ